VRILQLSEQPIYELPYTNAASGGGVESRALPVLVGTIDALPGDLSGLLVASDLQGVAPSVDRGGALALLGEVLAQELPRMEDLDVIPPSGQIGALLAGDLFAAPGGDRRGATGDVRPVWSAFARQVRWVAGVAGNHDLFGSERERERFVRSGAHLLDGRVVEIDGLRIGGVCGIVGNPNKPGRRDAGTFLGLIEGVLTQRPDILVLHEGPDDPTSGSKGNADVRELLLTAPDGLLVIAGHSPWKEPLASLGACQVLNVAERAVLLTSASLSAASRSRSGTT
jgi:hypothetical protein